MKLFKFKLVGSDGIRLEREVESLNCQTPLGEISVLADHQPLVTIVKSGRVTLRTGQREEVLNVVNDGILEVRPTEVRLISTF